MSPPKGRPTLHGAKMIRRTYQVTVEQDRAISQISAISGKSASAVVREGIELILGSSSIVNALTLVAGPKLTP
jgi:hypothetical protein